MIETSADVPRELPDVPVVAEILRNFAGGYLRNSLDLEGVTCGVCRGPSSGEPRCPQCRAAGSAFPALLADRVGVVTYAPDDGQTARAMYGYKQPQPLQEHRALVTLMCHVGLRGHIDCVGTLAGQPVSRWASVPSLRGRPGEHPLHVILRNIAREGTEIRLDAGATPADPRQVNLDAFTVLDDPSGEHVLLVDDTWTRGGHSQSAAAALKRAGASQVSILVLARWLKSSWSDHRHFVRTYLTVDFRTDLCPWTGGACPPRNDT